MDRSNPSVKPLQLLARHILNYAHDYEWSVQGLGMLRLYIGDIGRVHIWNSALRYPGVSDIHSHPWADLRSTIVAGQVTNRIYREKAVAAPYSPYRSGVYQKVRVRTGYDAQLVGESEVVRLEEIADKTYGPGDFYAQPGDRIHKTMALDGTVTVLERLDDANNEANVYVPYGEEFGTAKPHIASFSEVETAVNSIRWEM